MNKLFIGLMIVVILMSLSFLLESFKTTSRQQIQQIQQIQQLEEIKKEIESTEPYIEPYKDKGEIPQHEAFGAPIETIKVYDLDLTPEEYAVLKTKLINKYETKSLGLSDRERFIAMLNLEIKAWRKLNGKFQLTDVNEENLINKIVLKIK